VKASVQLAQLAHREVCRQRALERREQPLHGEGFSALYGCHLPERVHAGVRAAGAAKHDIALAGCPPQHVAEHALHGPHLRLDASRQTWCRRTRRSFGRSACRAPEPTTPAAPEPLARWPLGSTMCAGVETGQ
jgi:hypothetical protein